MGPTYSHVWQNNILTQEYILIYIGIHIMSERELKRISLLIGEDQYEAINKRGLNLSWLLRDLIDQYLSEKQIVIESSQETLEIYQKVVKCTGGLDEEFEPILRDALHTFLKGKIERMQKLEKQTFKKSGAT